jgi:2-methylisocitrate lyase-like PEP mutase family enzyme
MTSPRADLARQFHALHQDGILLLANAWDAGSARLIESVGAMAIATTSAGVAWSHGYADGDKLPVKVLAATVAEIVRVIRVPLTVDCEGGYSDELATVEENIGGVVDAGGIGINLEDGNRDVDLLCRKIERAARAGERRGVKLFINARTDPYLRSGTPAERRVEEVIARAERYLAAGASGLFVPGVVEAPEIRAIASGIKLSLNVLARPTLAPAAELARLGVRRLSIGAAIPEVLHARTAQLASAFLRDGASAPLAEGATAFRDINAFMAGH